MNSTLYNPADTELDIRCATSDTPVPEDMYATAPMPVVQSTCWRPDEEELHTSFEAAISDRVLAVNRQLRRLSSKHTGIQPQMNVLATSSDPCDCPRPLLRLNSWLRAILYAGIALMLVMVGFDLMGLLMLHMR